MSSCRILGLGHAALPCCNIEQTVRFPVVTIVRPDSWEQKSVNYRTRHLKKLAAIQSLSHINLAKLSTRCVLTARPVSHIMSKKQRNRKTTPARERPVEQIERPQRKIGLKVMATIVSLVQSPPCFCCRTVKQMSKNDCYLHLLAFGSLGLILIYQLPALGIQTAICFPICQGS